MATMRYRLTQTMWLLLPAIACGAEPVSNLDAERARVEDLVCTAPDRAAVETRLESEGFMYFLEKDGHSLKGVKHYSAAQGFPQDVSLALAMTFDANGHPADCALVIEPG